MQNEVQVDEVLSSDVAAFCALLARIMRRCIVERDERIMNIVSTSLVSIEQVSEAVYESAA